MKKIYFPNLNGIRFIAAFLVMVHHIEQFKSLYRLPNYFNNKTVGIIGELGVTLFFVLSGFLITYMLFVEKDHVGSIDIKGFYVRRILRIWPLYFLILILAFFVLPKIYFLLNSSYTQSLPYGFVNKLLLFIFFLPNAAAILYPMVPFAAQAWSIGVEEQFYLIWPIVIKFFKRPLMVLLSIVLLYGAIKLTLHYALQQSQPGPFKYKLLFTKYFLELTRINCMAIGGLGAYVLFEKKVGLLNLLYAKMTQVVVYLSTFLLIGFGVKILYLNDEIYSLLFMIIIMNLAVNKGTIFSLNNRVFDYLGKISYGLYMYHPLAIVLSIVLVVRANNAFVLSASNTNLAIYSLSIGITVFISACSYELLEKFFIKKKLSFSKVISGDNAKDC